MHDSLKEHFVSIGAIYSNSGRTLKFGSCEARATKRSTHSPSLRTNTYSDSKLMNANIVFYAVTMFVGLPIAFLAKIIILCVKYTFCIIVFGTALLLILNVTVYYLCIGSVIKSIILLSR